MLPIEINSQNYNMIFHLRTQLNFTANKNYVMFLTTALKFQTKPQSPCPQCSLNFKSKPSSSLHSVYTHSAALVSVSVTKMNSKKKIYQITFWYFWAFHENAGKHSSNWRLVKTLHSRTIKEGHRSISKCLTMDFGWMKESWFLHFW